MPAPEITIIGVGGLGKSLARALSAAEIPLKSIFNRTAHKAEKLAVELDVSISGSFPSDSDQLGDLTFITVSDSAIHKIVEGLTALSDNFESKIFIHCSGNESASLLKPLKPKGGVVASFHPLQTFTDDSGSSADFENIFFSLQGDEYAFPLLKQIAQKLGAHTLEVTETQKSHLHAAAVMASNYLNTLLNAAVEIASGSDLAPEEAKKALLPLVKTTLQNIERQSFGEALSGPIKRGDIQTVEQHLSLIKDKPKLLELYRTLGHMTAVNARTYQHIDEESAKKILNILKNSHG